MKARKLILVGLSLTLACTFLPLVALVIASHEQAERAITLILSTEIFTPALIFGLALTIYFSCKPHKWRYQQ
jgi:ABC-type spermidine/putrescine transport system permease subunit II